MISASHPFSSWFLVIATTGFLAGYALPLLFVPLAWARVLRWRIPAETDLTVYFGRCVGGLATAIIVMAYLAVPHPEQNVVLFDLIAVIGGIMVAVHVWGAVRRVQPWTETAEIPLYVALAVLAVLARPGVVAG